jgi:hypothetical protein
MPYCVDCGKKTQEGSRCSYCNVSANLSNEEKPKPKKIIGFIANILIILVFGGAAISLAARVFYEIKGIKLTSQNPARKGTLPTINYDKPYIPYANKSEEEAEDACATENLIVMGSAENKLGIPNQLWTYDYSDEDMNFRRICLILASCNSIDGKNNIFMELVKYDAAGQKSFKECADELGDQVEVEDSFPYFVERINNYLISASKRKTSIQAVP